MLWILAASLAATSVALSQVGNWSQAGQCTTNEQCNYNGQCMAGKCKCTMQWKGQNCDELNLLPTSQALGYHGLGELGPLSSWGGSVLYGDDGLYHMYAAEIEGSCGMNVWLSNSLVIHATSPDPTLYPFTRKGVVQEVFSHEPIAARAPTGEYVVYFTAVLPPGRLPVKGGERCSGCESGRSPQSCGTDDQRNASINLPTYMVYSSNPDGPWSTPMMIPGTDVFADSNFAPVINPNGSLVALERGNVIHASNWKDVSTYKKVGKWQDAAEDPFVWRDNAGIYHNIVHVNRQNTHGLHYYSTDGINWKASPGRGFAFTNRIEFADGTHKDLACRERPHIIQNKQGGIIGLTNGAAPTTCHAAGQDDYSFTSLQTVKQSSAPKFAVV